VGKNDRKFWNVTYDGFFHVYISASTVGQTLSEGFLDSGSPGEEFKGVNLLKQGMKFCAGQMALLMVGKGFPMH
jgi:hypothetical protein